MSQAGDSRAAARAIDALRRGWDIRISGADGALHLLAIETADMASVARLDADGSAALLISAARAETLKLTNQREAASEQPVLVERAPWIDADVAISIADPVRDLGSPLKGPFRAAHLAAAEAAEAALRLARIAGILPAFYVLGEGQAPAASAQVADIAAFDDPSRIHIATRARLPVEASVAAEIVAFRTPDDPREHVALILGKRDGSAPVARLHSECLTGDVLGSLKCDCGPQLHHALHEMAESQWGVLLYLRQEGRGIGLINKLRAYALQDQGFDTVDANVRLGFEVDARDFRIAAKMLALLGIPEVRLMTNNPQKVARLEEAGIRVAERLPLIVPTNPENEKYLATKRDRTGHQL